MSKERLIRYQDDDWEQVRVAAEVARRTGTEFSSVPRRSRYRVTSVEAGQIEIERLDAHQLQGESTSRSPRTRARAMTNLHPDTSSIRSMLEYASHLHECARAVAHLVPANTLPLGELAAETQCLARVHPRMEHEAWAEAMDQAEGGAG